MKKSLLFLIGAFAVSALQAQWVNDPATNTTLAPTSYKAGNEIYLRTHEATGNTYMQWNDLTSNGWSVNLQRIDVNGVPQWGEAGIHIGSHQFGPWSDGFDMAVTPDNNAITCFANADKECIVMRFDKDGNALWGEQGISVFEFPEESYGCSKVKLQAGTDGGVWVLADDLENTYLRYINADGTLNPTITISDEDSFCMYGLMTLGANETVFVAYKKMSPKDSPITSLNNEIWVASYNIDGTTATAPVQLMESKFFDQPLTHRMIPDGIGGGYAYICNDYVKDSILFNNNVYVFHFDANGQSTFSDLQGVAVHSLDEENHYTEPSATVDPITHDIILVYFQVPIITDPQDEHPELRILTNRITTTGEVLWGEGKLIDDNEGEKNFLNPTIDIYPDGSGFMIMYGKAYSIASNFATLEAYGYDMDANQTWHTQMCSVLDTRHISENTTGFHNGQNIIAWTSELSGNDGLIGQNIGLNGNMGPITSVSENESTMSASIFQNGNSLIVSSEGLSQVEIISITGQSIKTVEANGNAAEINLSGMTKGLYIVRMNDANGNVVVKKTVIR